MALAAVDWQWYHSVPSKGEWYLARASSFSPTRFCALKIMGSTLSATE